MSKKLFEIISQVMSIPISEINDKSSPENIEAWDSFNGLVLLDELESSFDVKFSLDEITDVKTVEDIKKHLKNHGVNLDE
jgi:acyl carrier protein